LRLSAGTALPHKTGVQRAALPARRVALTNLAVRRRLPVGSVRLTFVR